jgi:hypothetical protein
MAVAMFTLYPILIIHGNDLMIGGLVIIQD